MNHVTLRCKNVCIPRPNQLVVDGAGELVGGARLIVAGLHPEPGVGQELHDVGAVDPLTRRDRVTPLGEILAKSQTEYLLPCQSEDKLKMMVPEDHCHYYM